MHASIAYENVICNSSAQNENTLVRIDDIVKNYFESVGDNTGNNLIQDVAETNMAKVHHGGRFLKLRDKSNDHRVSIFKRISIVEDPQSGSGGLVANGVSGILEEQGYKTVLAWCF